MGQVPLTLHDNDEAISWMMAKMMGICPPGRGSIGRYHLFLSIIARVGTKSLKPLTGMYWLGLTDIAAEGVWLDNYGNEVDMSTMSATIDNAGGNQHCLVWFFTFFLRPKSGISGPDHQKPIIRRDL